MIKRRISAPERRLYNAAVRLYSEKGTYEVTVSELAQEAGVARGTVYKYLESPEKLFNKVASRLAKEMINMIEQAHKPDASPAEKLATGIRLCIRRTHEEPHWGRFVLHFGLTTDSLKILWQGPPMEDIKAGLSSQLYDINSDTLPSAVGMIGGVTVSGILLVLEGIKTWRDAGTDSATFALRALGVEKGLAETIATSALPVTLSN
jgi:AcrR family transcriptional regulator